MKILDRTQLLLKETKMTQLELAERIGVAFTALNRLLQGHSGKASIALKLEAFLEENGYPHDIKVTQETSKEERENAS
jgi:transcriptional regulator with XRE-family HTH domain